MLLSLLVPITSQSDDVITFTRIANRQRSEVCALYESHYKIKQTGATWTSTSTDTCDLGKYDEAADHRDAKNRLTYYRFLAGMVRPITFNPNYTKGCRECATAAKQKGQFTHDLPTTAKCYTPDAKKFCASSNLAGGAANGAGDISMYVNEGGGLGHRKWCLNPQNLEFGLGRSGVYGALHVFGKSVPKEPETPFFAYPSDGPIHYKHVPKHWNFNTHLNCTEGKLPKSVKITRISDKVEVPIIDKATIGGVAGMPGFRFQINTSYIKPEDGYVVQITTDKGVKFRYIVKATDCESKDMTDKKFESLMNANSIINAPKIGPGGIAAIVLGIIAFAAIVAFVVFLVFFRNKVVAGENSTEAKP